jgi:GTP-binding protein
MTLKIALVGRPNVGKSTLFNRIIGKKHAIVDDRPGVTRDRREGEGKVGPLSCIVYDTPGLEEAESGSLESRMMQQTDAAVADSDIVLFMVDARAGILPDDKHFAKWLRARNKPVILAVNKAEGKNAYADSQLYKLGFKEMVFISAEHGEGFAELYDALASFEASTGKGGNKDYIPQLNIAIVGRPNAGKSTLINALVKQDRVLTGPEAGITRDAISINWVYKGRAIKLVDTAGIRKKYKKSDKLEQLAVADSFRAIQYAQVVCLLIDATIPLEAQDIAIANKVLEEGRSLIIAINKWDLVTNKEEYTKYIKEKIEDDAYQLKGLPIVFLSALHSKKLDNMLDTAFEVFDKWSTKVPTGGLNRWLEMALHQHTPPLSSTGKAVKIKYITQIKIHPPTFILFTNYPKDIPEHYMRYLNKSLREHFDILDVPIRMSARKSGKNPYV